MSNVEFDGDQSMSQFKSRVIIGQAQVPGMAAWLLKKGIIKNEEQAGGVLIGLVIFNFIVMGAVLYFFVF